MGKGTKPHRRCAMTHRLYFVLGWSVGPVAYSTQSPSELRGSESSHTKPSTCLPIGTEPPQLSYSGITCEKQGRSTQCDSEVDVHGAGPKADQRCVPGPNVNRRGGRQPTR